MKDKGKWDEQPINEGTYGMAPVKPVLTIRELARIDAGGPLAAEGIAAAVPSRRRRMAEKAALRERAQWDRDEERRAKEEKQDDNTEYLPQKGRGTRRRLAFYAPPMAWHTASINRSGLLNPLGVSGHTMLEGPVIGRSLMNGNVFRYDCWAPAKAYAQESVNGLIIGMMNSGKSMLLKALATRETASPWNRKSIIEGDPKSEWKPIAKRIGGQVVSVGDGAYLNPLDPGEKPDTMDAATWDSTVLGLQRKALEFITDVLRPERPLLSDIERAVVDASLRHYIDRLTPPSITELVELWRSEWAAGEHIPGLTVEAAQLASNSLILLFDQMVHGVEAGAFEKDSTIRIDPKSPMTVFDTGSVADQDEHKKKLYQACMGAAVERLCARHDGEFRIVIAEEGHELLNNPSLVRAWERRMRLQGDLGVSNWMLLHELSDIEKFADQGTAERKLMESILTLSSVQVIYRQSPSSLAIMKKLIGNLSPSEVAQINNLPPAAGLWRVGGKFRDVVRAEFSAESFQLFRTDQYRKG